MKDFINKISEFLHLTKPVDNKTKVTVGLAPKPVNNSDETMI